MGKVIAGVLKALEMKDGTIRVVIPKSIKEHLKIKKGDSLVCYYQGGGKIIYVKQKLEKVE